METVCLQKELLRMREAITIKLRDYSPPPGENITDRLLQIFKKHSRSDINSEEQTKVRSAINLAIKKDSPINVSFLWALGGNAKSKWKFLQPHLNLPRFGDFWAFVWLHMVDSKVKTIYPPGCRFVIVDEVPLIKLIPRWNQAKIDERKQALIPVRKFVSQADICDLPDFNGMYPSNPISDYHPGEILAILLSRPDLENAIGDDKTEILYRDLYRTREKDWNAIRLAIPDALWEEAVEIRKETARINQLRKETNWVGEQFFKGESFIDGALTEKGRWCPRIWPETSTFPQHGGTTLKAGQGSFSVGIDMESRLVKTHRPVYINPLEFGLDYRYEPFIFYWENEDGS